LRRFTYPSDFGGADAREAAMTGNIRVSVDKDFARFGGKSYAINKINTVEVRERRPHGVAGALVCAFIVLICVLSAAGGGGAGAIGIAAFFTVLAYFSWRKSQRIEYQLFLMTSSSEAQALASRDRLMIMNLREQIERAMCGHIPP
jgi:hypothetical protein